MKQDILQLVAEINRAEKEDDFPARETKCEWCGFWDYCPKKKHLRKVETLPKNKYLKDGGVKLANKYSELADRRSVINRKAKTEAAIVEKEMEEVAEAILKYAAKHNIEALRGSKTQVVINKEKVYALPVKTLDLEKYTKLENLLKGTKYWELVSSINGTKFKQLLKEGGIDKRLEKNIVELAPLEESVSISVKKNKKDE